MHLLILFLVLHLSHFSIKFAAVTALYPNIKYDMYSVDDHFALIELTVMWHNR